MEDVDETAAGKMVTNMRGLMNHFFSDRNAERTRVGMEKSARIGRFPFKAPVGYLNIRATRDTANLIPDPERAPLVRKAFDLYGTGTVSRADALRQVTNLGLTAHGGKPLAAQSFENLLRNPIYAGWVVIPTWNLRASGSFEALVSDELFQRVQDIMDGKKTAIVPHRLGKLLSLERGRCAVGQAQEEHGVSERRACQLYEIVRSGEVFR